MRGHMNTLILLLFLTTYVYAFKFLQLTDNHYDWEVGVGKNPKQKCRSGTGDSGVYGYADRTSHCQAPLSILKSACTTATEEELDAVFLTGDFQRSGNTKRNVTREIFLENMQVMTDIFTESWPNTPVLPVIGNHDSLPEDLLEPGPSWLYDELSKQWGQWMDENALQTFQKGGYYSMKYSNLPKAKFMVLNTCLYTLHNNLTVNMTDPANQFSWMKDELTASRSESESVWLLYHCNPGVEFQISHNNAIVQILSDFSDVIRGQVVGHIHHDLFELIMDEGGKGDVPVGVMFLCPSISPDNGEGGAHAPAYRVYDVREHDYVPIDYSQITLNLTNANQGTVEWNLEYSAVEAYNLTDLTPREMYKLYHNLIESDELWNQWWDRLWGGWEPQSDHASCSEVCKDALLLAMRYVVPPI